MDALEMSLLFDYYGDLLTDRQRLCLDMHYNQDLSLGEIAQDMGVSRQAVCDNLHRTEAILRKMEENVGYVSRDLKLRKVLRTIKDAAQELYDHSDKAVVEPAKRILAVVDEIEE